MIPRDNEIVNVFEFNPLANAFKESSSIMFILGVAMPTDMHRFSTRLYTLLFSFLVRGLDDVAASIMELWENHAIKNHMITPTVIQGMVIKKSWLTAGIRLKLLSP